MKTLPGMRFTLAALVMLCACVAALSVPDRELDRLEAALAAAKTQTDLNLCSSAVAKHLDAKLQALEVQIEKGCDAKALPLFRNAAQTWRAYRQKEMKFEGDLYRGGSAQPLICNMVSIRLTKERLQALRDSEPEGRFREN